MNVGFFSTPLAVSSADLKPAELNSVGRTSVDSFLSTRPVPTVDAVSPANRIGSPTDKLNQSEETIEQDREELDNAEAARVEQRREEAVLKQEQEEIQQLSARDREVRAHEQAHAAVGGQYAGAPQYQFQRGPDGVRYAVGGEVSIDVSRAATPEETIRKMQVVRRAALAPAEPSPQDRRVAAQAAATEAEARQELAIETREAADSERSGENDASSNEAVNGSSQSELQNRADLGTSDATQAGSVVEPLPSFSPVQSGLPPSAITNLLQNSILASEDRLQPGSIINQLA